MRIAPSAACTHVSLLTCHSSQQIMEKPTHPRLGAHMSIDGGLHRALERGHSIGCEAIQLFTRNNVRWKAKARTEEELRLYRETLTRTGIVRIDRAWIWIGRSLVTHSIATLTSLGLLQVGTIFSSIRGYIT